MRTVRPLTGTALAVAAAGLAAAGPAAAPAYGAADGLEVYPATVAPGDEVTVNTAACGGNAPVTGDAAAVGAGSFTLAPSEHEEDAVGHFDVPPSAQPGTYEIVARCSDGGRITADLVVSLAAGARPERPQESVPSAPATPDVPKGSVKTGVGGALGPDPARTAAGVAALAVAAAGGTWLLHRRARGDGI
ncbi:hypothetical protein [Streptomyces minutiscleroticus]|uniref:Uncharacterized protein n=1 Tax=Streptomyces minutiscleroticus TaxID=68238 RepID=A0A918N7S7_9ACTN|nr:hypothetical protein [Streptomyces minutiscleroticus]GGX51735.1 hypothetical protein GCM10010358_01700 [Streptomyces minutiscleroticus]